MQLPAELMSPPNEYSLIPFWFWNDELNEAEILRQIDDFEKHGVHGFVIHPRVGLPRHQGWMSDELLNFYDIALAEAEHRGMKVMLYDEGMYPSGSSCGQVVARNPEFQCRGLARVMDTADHPYQLKADENLVARIEGSQECFTIIDRKVDAVIRGLHYIDEGPEEDTPLASDILNPEAVDCFIELVYKKFAERFSRYFGDTIIGIFTDEADMLGRCNEDKAEVLPGTRNIIPQINDILGYDFTPYLSKLWSNDSAQRDKYRAIYEQVCSLLLDKTYYSRLSAFCRENNIQLTGHPARSDDLGALRYYDIPGQDVVWRWVEPDKATALEGVHSTQAKCSSSAMIHTGRRRNLNEFCGAYGHELTWDEMNWLGNWLMVRGVNMLVPHAFYYSVRGPRRDERPTDVGLNASWWIKYKEHADFFKRLCWINTDSKPVCRVAILGKVNELPWRSAKVCFENQIDFHYLEERHLWEDAQIYEHGIELSGMHYDVLITELHIDDKAVPAIEQLQACGRVYQYSSDTDNNDLVGFIAQHVSAGIQLSSYQPALRVRHVVKEGLHYFMLFNENREPFTIDLRVLDSTKCAELDCVSGNLIDNVSLENMRFAGHEMKVMVLPS